MKLNVRESLTERSFSGTDEIHTIWGFHFNYFDLEGLTEFLEWCNVSLIKFAGFHPLFTITVMNDQGGNLPPWNMYYSVKIETDIKDMAMIIKLRWSDR